MDSSTLLTVSKDGYLRSFHIQSSTTPTPIPTSTSMDDTEAKNISGILIYFVFIIFIGRFYDRKDNQVYKSSILNEGLFTGVDDKSDYHLPTNSFDFSLSPFETTEYSFQSLDMLLAGMDRSSSNQSSFSTSTSTSSSLVSTKFISATSIQSIIHIDNIDSIDSISLSSVLISISSSTSTTSITPTNNKMLSIVTERGIDVISLILRYLSIAY